MRLLINELKRSICSRKYIVSSICYALLLCLGVDTNYPGGVIYQFTNIYTTGFYMLFFLCATIPFADSYLSDRQSVFFPQIIVRTSRSSYLRTKIIVTVISGVSSIILSSLLLICYLFLRYPMINTPLDYTGYGVLINSNHIFAYFFVRVTITCAIGSIFSTAALMMSPLIKNIYAINVLPLLFYYLYNEMINLGLIPDFLNITRMLYSTYSSFGGLWINYCYAILFSCVLIMLLGRAFMHIAGRQIENG